MSEEVVNLEINGVSVKARKGAMIIKAADDAGIYIPRFCYHEKLSVAANCRMCLIEVEKVGKPLPACATPVGEGMKVITNSPRALAAQKATMEFLLINHPLDCPVCDQGGECELQDLALGYGKDVSRYQEGKRSIQDKNIGPLIQTVMTRCIYCTRCVRFGTEIAGIQELGGIGRSENTEIGTYIENSVDHELSGNVIDLCPVGALNSKPFKMHGRGWEMTAVPSVAPHDCVGSNVYAHSLRGELLRVVPKDNEAINEYWISDRDRFGYEGINSADRLHQPQVKTNGEWRKTDWDTALQAAANALRNAGLDMGALISPNTTVEEQYLLQALIRSQGSNNIDHRLRQTDFRADEAAPTFPSLGLSLAELEKVDAALLVGANVRKEAPLLGHRLRKAAMRGGKLHIIEPRSQEYFFPVAQRFNAEFALELAAILKALEEVAGKPAAKTVHKALADITPGKAHLATAKQLLEAGSVSILLGRQAQMAGNFADLRALTAAIADLSGATLGYLTEGANSAGAWLVGAVPHRLADGKTADGMNVQEMFAEPRRVYALYGVEPEYDSAMPGAALAALQAAEQVVVFTPFVTEAMQAYATVLLPIGTFGETSGTFVNGAGQVQGFTGVVLPTGEARPGWKVLRVLGNLLDVPEFDYMDSTEVRTAALNGGDSFKPDNRYKGKHVVTLPAESATGFRLIPEVCLYATDALVRRAGSLQLTQDAREALCVRLHSIDAERLGVGEGELLVLQQAGSEARLPLTVDDSLAPGSAVAPAGLGATVALKSFADPLEIRKA